MQVRGVAGVWVSIEKVPLSLMPGVALRAGRQSTAYVSFSPQDTALLQEDTVFILEEGGAERLLARVEIGVAMFRFASGKGRKVQVRTPAAALTSRGAEFRLSVLAGGRTTVELTEGELGVSDNRGHQLLLRAGESVRVDMRGLEVPRRMPAVAALRREGLRDRIRKEAEGDIFRERLYAAHADGLQRAEWEEGRALIDSTGHRVRVESWVRRPRADQLEFVVLNARPGRTDYFYQLGTYDAALPTDLGDALRAMAGTVDSRGLRTLLAYETVRSNGQDVMLEMADGGHLVDLNANAVGGDDVEILFDPTGGTFSNAVGRAAFRPLFDRYGLYLNGRLALGWTGADIQSLGAATGTTANDPFSGAALTAANAFINAGQLAAGTVSLTAPISGAARQLWFTSWSEGSSVSIVSTALEGPGLRAAALPAVGGAAAFRSALLGARLEQSVASSAFGGRRIELIIDPALALSAGLVP